MKINIDRKVDPNKPLIEKYGNMFLFNNELRFVAQVNGLTVILSQNGFSTNSFNTLKEADKYYSSFKEDRTVEKVASVTLEVE